MKQKTAMQSMIEWARENSMEVVTPNGFAYDAVIDLELMEKKFKEWLAEERKQIEDAFSAGESNNEFHDVLFTDKEAYFNENFETEQP
jgi:hypothetical protein